MTTPIQLTRLYDIAAKGNKTINGREYLPAPSNPASAGTWSLATTLGGGGRYQVWGMAKHAGAMLYGIGGEVDGVGAIWRCAAGVWSNVTPWSGGVMRVPTIFSRSDGYVYAGTASANGDTQIWRSLDGVSWTMWLNFGTSVLHLMNFSEWNGHLYVGVDRKSGNGELWSSSNNWVGPVWTAPGNYVYKTKVHNNKLYLGTGYPAEVFEFNGTTATQISAFNNPDLLIVEDMESYRGDLVVSFGRNYWVDPAPPCVMSFNAVNGWAEVGKTQPNEWGTSHNFNALLTFKDNLLASMGSNYGGISLWMLNGEHWNKIASRPIPFGEDVTGLSLAAEWIYRMVADGDIVHVGNASIQIATQPAIWDLYLP